MARTLSTVNFYKNINLPRDYSQVCDNITLNNISSYLTFTISNLSVIRHNIESGSFRVEKSINDLSYINYICILNNSTDRSQIYAFIDNLEYVADNITNVTFSIDLFTTYCQGLDYQDTYISRMTTSDDTLGKYIESESVDGGDYVTNSVYDEVINNWYYGVLATSTPSGTPISGHVINNIYLQAELSGYDNYQDLSNKINDFQRGLNNNVYTDNICSIFQYPAECGGSGLKVIENKNISFPNTLDNYQPKNKKLLNYPYIRAIIVDSDGDNLEIKPELTQNRTLSYKIEKIAQPMTNITLTLESYDGNSAINEKINRLILTGFPECTWSSDNYKAWLARNKVNRDMEASQIIANVAVAGIATASGQPAVGSTFAMSAINGVASMYKENENAKTLGQTIHRGGSVGIDVTNNKFGFTILIQSITARQASLIDNFFTAFGYAINKVTYFSPSRTRFDYVETKGNLFRRKAENSGVPNIALDTINSRANSGIRIWHSVSELNRGNLVDTNSIR